MKRILLAITLIILLTGCMGSSSDDGGGEEGGSEGGGTGTNYTVEHFENDGIVSGLVGVGMNDEYQFPVKEGAFKVVVILNGSETTGAEDLDMEVDGPAGGKKTSGNPGSNEMVVLNYLDISKRFGYGDYTVKIIAYVALATTYHLSVDVYYPAE